MEQNNDNNQIFLLHGAMVVVATTAALGGGWLPNFGAPKRVEPSFTEDECNQRVDFPDGSLLHR